MSIYSTKVIGGKVRLTRAPAAVLALDASGTAVHTVALRANPNRITVNAGHLRVAPVGTPWTSGKVITVAVNRFEARRARCDAHAKLP